MQSSRRQRSCHQLLYRIPLHRMHKGARRQRSHTRRTCLCHGQGSWCLAGLACSVAQPGARSSASAATAGRYATRVASGTPAACRSIRMNHQLQSRPARLRPPPSSRAMLACLRHRRRSGEATQSQPRKPAGSCPRMSSGGASSVRQLRAHSGATATNSSPATPAHCGSSAGKTDQHVTHRCSAPPACLPQPPPDSCTLRLRPPPGRGYTALELLSSQTLPAAAPCVAPFHFFKVMRHGHRANVTLAMPATFRLYAPSNIPPRQRASTAGPPWFGAPHLRIRACRTGHSGSQRGGARSWRSSTLQRLWPGPPCHRCRTRVLQTPPHWWRALCRQCRRVGRWPRFPGQRRCQVCSPPSEQPAGRGLRCPSAAAHGPHQGCCAE